MADVAPSLVDTVAFEDKNLVSVLVNGWVPGSILFRGIRMLEGRAFGARRQEGRHARPGPGADPGQEGRRHRSRSPASRFKVVGIFESDSWFENGALTMPLATLQTMMGREGQVTGFLIQAKSSDARSIDALRKRIESTITGVAATPARDHVRATPRSGLPGPWPGRPPRSP